MKTTLELPDELMRQVKMHAVRENRKLKDVVADLLRRGLVAQSEAATAAPRRVQLPLIRGAHPARPEDEMTPERLADALLEQDIQTAAGDDPDAV